MAHYYFVATALPGLSLGTKPEMGFKEFRQLLSLNLTAKDFKLFERLLWSVDLYNIRALWLGLPLDEKGTLSARDLEEALLVKERIPSYLVEFLERYESSAERLRYFPSLFASFYREERTRFLAKYFAFERSIRLVLTALRGKKEKRDLVRELQFEDPTDPLVAQILAQKDAPDYTPPMEFEDLKALFVENSSEPKKMGHALLAYRFEAIEEMQANEHFTIDQILGYAAQLIIVEEWQSLNWEKGRTALEEMTRYG